MTPSETFAAWCLVIGLLLVAMTMSRSLVARLPLSAAMLYLGVGYALGPAGVGLISLDPIRNAVLLEHLTEIALLISLFIAGFKLEQPWRNQRWRIPVQLASISMLVTVGALSAVGVLMLGLPLGGAVLLGAILAPTDPVLASDVQLASSGDRDRVRYGLTGEGGLNDGSAFPFVMLGLGLLALHDLGAGGWRWWTVDVLWAVAGGIAIGYLLGLAVGTAVVHLRVRHRQALGADEFIALGLIALAYGSALALSSYGFLAVFAAGVALRKVDERALQASSRPGSAPEADDAARGTMVEVQRFNEQLERVAEVAIVLVVGALLARVRFDRDLLWLVPFLFLVIRPIAVAAGLAGTGVTGTQRVLMSWFGIRGIGSIYYLMYAITHGIKAELAQRLVEITIGVVVASIVAHGVSVTPLMNRYERRKSARQRL